MEVAHVRSKPFKFLISMPKNIASDNNRSLKNALKSEI